MPIALLRQEHHTLRQMLAVAGSQTAQIASSGHIDAEAMNALLDLFKTSLDRRHFSKEERCLHPFLRTGNLASQHRTMLDDHRTLRRCRRELAAALLAAEQGEELAIPKIFDLLQIFSEKLKEHLDWEELELYPRLDQYLHQESRSQLQACFERIDAAEMEG